MAMVHGTRCIFLLERRLLVVVGKFNQAVETFGMQKSKSDHSIFYKDSSSSIILLVVYVDDIVIIGSDSKCILSLKSFLHNQFHTKDLGMLKYFLGVEVMRVSREFCYLNRNMYLICYLRQINWTPNHVVLLWLIIYNSLRKENYLKTLRDIEDWLGN